MATFDLLTIPDDLIWTDEFDFSPVEASLSRTLSGDILIQTGAKVAGRPITLSGATDSGWITRATLEALYAKLATTTPMTLVLPGNRTFSVYWRHFDTPIEARPIVDYFNPAAGDFYSITLRFITAA